MMIPLAITFVFALSGLEDPYYALCTHPAEVQIMSEYDTVARHCAEMIPFPELHGRDHIVVYDRGLKIINR